MQLERRRQAVPPPVDAPGDPRLVALLRTEIEASGALTFARFMQRALYEPELGYYATSAARPTPSGDYLTAAELHPIFGHCLARQLDQMWRLLGEPDDFVLRDYGAGSGALASAIADELARSESALLNRLHYQPVDQPLQLRAIADRLAAAGRQGLFSQRAAEDRFVGCVLANEFLDALPVHRVTWQQGRLREIYVGWRADRFIEVIGEPSTPRLAEWFAATGVELAEGQRAEVNLAMLDWLAEVAAVLSRGFGLVIDYGADAVELYGSARRAGTLRAFRQQHVGGDPLRGVGRQDLTAHVDLAALRNRAAALGLVVLGGTTQAEFLMGNGLERLVETERRELANEWPPWLQLRSAIGRLLDPRALGGYAVIVLGAGLDEPPPTLAGLDYRLSAHG